MLLMIFNHLKPEDKCMKAITETCRIFKEICESSLTHLHVDFETIKNSGQSLVCQRAYKEISVVNFEMPVNMIEMLNLFRSSIESVRKLNIGDESSILMSISRKALRFLFRCFPNVEELKITETTMTQRSSLKICRNDLAKLKVLHLHDVTDDVFRSLEDVTWLDEIHIIGSFHSNSEDFQYFITHQTDLTMLEMRPSFFDPESTVIPTLRTFSGVACAYIEKLFEFAPNLEHLELMTKVGNDLTCTSVKTY